MATTSDPSATQAFELSSRLASQATVSAKRERGAPQFRPLQIYTLDPSVSARAGGVATISVPYEKLDRGPKGALFDVRCDGAPRLLGAEALDLDDPHLLMSSGLSPTPRDGRFHLQMVYAVASLTYAAFRRALGREIPWATQSVDNSGRLIVRTFVPGANAGYSREAGDLSFGYFKAGRRPAGFTVAGGLISTALSHDVIAHETTHALLDALRSSFMEPTNVDVPAFHEGFADLVALFLHFSYADVVERGIRDATGTVTRGSLLSDLAREFGYARSRTGAGHALRSGIDVGGLSAFDSDLAPAKDGGPMLYDPKLEPHALGSVLVSAVFEAFVSVVRRKSERLFRIAGVDPSLEQSSRLSDALVKALAQEASDVAAQFLNVCIRAIDYCPPVDIEFGEYLRAMITADGDMERTDKWGFREALMRSFRRRHILPQNVLFLSEDAMRWQPPAKDLNIPGLAFSSLRFAGDPAKPAHAGEVERQAKALGAFVTDPKNAACFRLVAPTGKLPKDIVQAPPAIVQSVRVARRVTPQGSVAFDIVGEVTQTCTVKRGNDLYEVHGGCTVIVDPDGDVRYVIDKRFDGKTRRDRQHAAMTGALKQYWMKEKGKWRTRPGMLQRLHAGR